MFGALCFVLPSPLLAAPVVINGIYPRGAEPANAPENDASAMSANAAPAVAPAADPYGGGLLELLLTGRSGAAPPQSQPSQAYALASTPPSYAQPPRATSPVVYGAPDATGAVMAEPADLGRGISPIYERQEVDYDGSQKPGTIVIDTPHKFLFLVQAGGKALRYGIGVGRPGFTWSGVKRITRKAEWPAWTPPADMLKRRPDLPTHMAGGPENPLGARALYLGSSLYRIHGTNEPNTIGTNVSSGCIRMMNKDVEDLYNRVGVGTKVVIM
jgi:lipoprotein-anchoring transpeptidase ErfK/SrfK